MRKCYEQRQDLVSEAYSRESRTKGHNGLLNHAEPSDLFSLLEPRNSSWLSRCGQMSAKPG